MHPKFKVKFTEYENYSNITPGKNYTAKYIKNNSIYVYNDLKQWEYYPYYFNTIRKTYEVLEDIDLSKDIGIQQYDYLRGYDSIDSNYIIVEYKGNSYPVHKKNLKIISQAE